MLVDRARATDIIQEVIRGDLRRDRSDVEDGRGSGKLDAMQLQVFLEPMEPGGGGVVSVGL